MLLVYVFGILTWNVAYAFMMRRAWQTGLAAWPPLWGSYWVTWEFLDAVTNWMSVPDRPWWKRVAHLAFFTQEMSMMLIWMLWDDTSRVFGEATPREKIGVFILVVFFWVVCTQLAHQLDQARRWKYFGYVWHTPLMISMIRLPVYANGDAEGVFIIALQAIANTAYIFRAFTKGHSPRPVAFFRAAAFGLALSNWMLVLWGDAVRGWTDTQAAAAQGTWLAGWGVLLWLMKA